MIDELFNFGIEHANSSIIKVIGVGGGGCNAVKHMFEEGIVGVDFIICNTDAQAMQNNPVPIRIQLG
jgi:cell division protein FtsZ